MGLTGPNLVVLAERLARRAHRDQSYGSVSYVDGHVALVVRETVLLASTAGFDEGSTVVVAAVAWLHDILEDHPDVVSLGFIAEWFGPDVAAAVDALTRRDGEAYAVYLRRACSNRVAVIVKKADNLVNGGTLEALAVADPARASRLRRRYVSAASVIDAALFEFFGIDAPPSWC